MCIEREVEVFQGISLQEMDAVKLMNRTDRKFWFHRDLLGDLLSEITPHYSILEIAGERNMPYSTTYYDTPLDEMYLNHHRGKLNRYKIRRRNYLSTSSSFLEVKFKSNKGRTIKVRQASEYCPLGFDLSDSAFIEENTPYSSDQLRVSLSNDFRRLMLVSKGMNERCTIDSGLRFVSNDSQVELSELVVVEVKSDGRNPSAIVDALAKRRIKASGFSKYCIGRTLTNTALKQNRFKAKHREITKKIENPTNYIDLWRLNG